MTTVFDKFIHTLIGTAILLLVANKGSYMLTEKLFSNHGYIAINGCPTATGHLVHAVIFFILVFSIMLIFNLFRNVNKNTVMIKSALICTLLFFIITNTEIYKITGSLTGGLTADQNGCATIWGLLLHTMLFFLIAFAIMFIPSC